MKDDFDAHQTGLTCPAIAATAITPNDSTDLANATRAIYVGGAGSLAVVFVEGQSVTFSGVAAGTILPLRLSRVLATGTTATGLVGLR